MFSLHHLRLAVLLPLVTLADEPVVIEKGRLHLGRAGQWEWHHFKNKQVDGTDLERRFQSRANTDEQTLELWQSDVKQGWQVLLNGKKLGTLERIETPTVRLLPIPAGALLDGENLLQISAPEMLDDIEIGPITLHAGSAEALLRGAEVEVVVTEEKSGAALPSRLTVTRPDGTLQPLLAEPKVLTATRTGVVYTRAGTCRLSLPAGDYVIHAGRGMEWGIARAPLRLAAGDKQTLKLTLRREVPTPGWIAADSHIHTLTHSGHGDATLAERVLTIAGEGIELAIATDHNHHTDYAPATAAADLGGHFTPVIGNEVTTKHGHFNAFPMAPGAPLPDHQLQDWARLLPEIRATPGVRVITLNHPRDLHSGFVPLGGVQFNPRTGKHRQAAALDIDAMEVVTSAAMQSDLHLLYRDWFALLNRGHRIAAIASSDTHDVNRFILGQGRTYVSARDADPSRLNLEEIWSSYRKGRLLVSLGLLAHLRVDDRFGVGDLATGLGDTVRAEATVLGPAWARVDHVALYANGILVREQAIHDPGTAGEKARVVWDLPKPAHDAHWVVIATGPGVTEPYWEIPRPYQPSSKTLKPRVLGSTNPVWIDADGDGRFQSAFACAQALVARHGPDDDALKAALRDHDEAVAAQVDSLRPARQK